MNGANEQKVRSKILRYCAWQERSHAEVRSKLYSEGLRKPAVEKIIAELIAEDYLNEERFARAFCRGKFNLKSWGKTKIKIELRQKGVSDANIRAAFSEIDDEQYLSRLKKLLDKKYNSLKSGRQPEKIFKTKQFLMQKGFEPSLIQQLLNEKRG